MKEKRNIIILLSLILVLSLFPNLIIWIDDKYEVVWLIRFLSNWIMPIFYFFIIDYYFAKKIIKKRRIVIVLFFLLISTTIINTLLIEQFTYKSRLALLYGILRIIWIILCGIFIISHSIFYQKYNDKPISKKILFIESIVILAVNVFSRYFAMPIVNRYSIDGEEIAIMLISLIVLLMYSYLLGRTITKDKYIFKLCIWNVSVFIAVFIEGAIHLELLKIEKISGLFISIGVLLIISAIAMIFATVFSIIGYIKPIQRIKALKNKE